LSGGQRTFLRHRRLQPLRALLVVVHANRRLIRGTGDDGATLVSFSTRFRRRPASARRT
jgi:hypothetical protein